MDNNIVYIFGIILFIVIFFIIIYRFDKNTDIKSVDIKNAEAFVFYAGNSPEDKLFSKNRIKYFSLMKTLEQLVKYSAIANSLENIKNRYVIFDLKDANDLDTYQYDHSKEYYYIFLHTTKDNGNQYDHQTIMYYLIYQIARIETRHDENQNIDDAMENIFDKVKYLKVDPDYNHVDYNEYQCLNCY